MRKQLFKNICVMGLALLTATEPAWAAYSYYKPIKQLVPTASSTGGGTTDPGTGTPTAPTGTIALTAGTWPKIQKNVAYSFDLSSLLATTGTVDTAQVVYTTQGMPANFSITGSIVSGTIVSDIADTQITVTATYQGQTTTQTYTLSQYVPETISALSISNGRFHNCAVTATHGVQCWGSNTNGELGNGTTSANSPNPVAVVGLSNGVKQVTTGHYHTCALLDSGAVKCWGKNDSGQLGTGTAGGNQTTPVTAMISGVLDISAGADYTCAVVVGGYVKCWGNNTNSVMANVGTTATPTQVNGTGTFGTGVLDVEASSEHTCVRASDKTVWCWGNGDSYQMGNTRLGIQTTPATITSMQKAEKLSLGLHNTCIITATNGAYCVGENVMTGQYTIGRASVPTAVPFVNNDAVDISNGYASGCVKKTDNKLYCWGYGMYGINGDTTSLTGTTPAAETGTVLGFSTDSTHCAIESTGKLKCWGTNAYGMTGLGMVNSNVSAGYPIAAAPDPTDTTNNDAPVSFVWNDGFAIPNAYKGTAYSHDLSQYVTIFGTNPPAKSAVTFSAGATLPTGLGIGNTGTLSGTPSTATAGAAVNVVATYGTSSGSGTYTIIINNTALQATQMVGGDNFSCALLVNGDVYCWGTNSVGQLGNGTTTASSTPVKALLSGAATKITGGVVHMCALITGGTIQCWGNNGFKQIGKSTGTSYSTPQTLAGTGYSDIAAGFYHTCAVASGVVKCWGYNSNGQTGGTVGTDNSSPTTITGVTTAALVYAGGNVSCFANSSYAFQCWGQGATYYQLGNYTGSTVTPRTIVGAPATIKSIGIGESHFCAVDTAGALWCWGTNSNNQLGDGTTTATQTPKVIIASGVDSVVGGQKHTCAKMTDGSLKCWGKNDFGQVGDGSTTARTTPVAVPLLGTSVKSIFAGRNHQCATLTDNSATCWGLDTGLQLGDDSTAANKSTPVYVQNIN